MTPSEDIGMFLSFLRDSELEIEAAKQNLAEAEMETQDILHAVEFGDYNGRKTASITKALQEVRLKRRSAKDILETYEPILRWSSEQKEVIKSLERLLGEVRKSERRHQNRIYIPRTTIMMELGKEKTKTT